MNINFKQERNLNQLLEDTSKFAKENYKQLGTMLLNWAGPFVLISAIAATYLQTEVAVYATGNGNIVEQYQAMSSSFYYWPTLIFNLLSGTIMMAIIFSYIKNYIKNGAENISQELILEDVKTNFLLILGTNLVVGIATLVGILLFIVGAIFLFVALSLTIIIRLYESKPLGEAMSRSLYLVKNNWWDTATKIIVLYIIILLFGYAFALPELLYNFMSGFNSAGTGISESSIIAIILSSFTTFASSLFTSILYIGIAFIYFNLIEKKEAHDLRDRIGNF